MANATWASIAVAVPEPLRRAVTSVDTSTVAAAFEAFLSKPLTDSEDERRYPNLPANTQEVLHSLSTQRGNSCSTDGDHTNEPLSQSDINAAAADAALLGDRCRHPSGNLLPLLIPHAVVSRDVARYLSHRLPATAMDGRGIDTSPWLTTLDLRLLRKQSALTLSATTGPLSIFKALLPHLPELEVVDAAVFYDCCEVAKGLAEALHDAPPTLGVCITGCLARGMVSQLQPIADRLLSLDVEGCPFNEEDALFLERLPRLRAIRAGTVAELSRDPEQGEPRRAQALLSASVDKHSFLPPSLPLLLSLSVKTPSITLPTVLDCATSLTRLELLDLSCNDDIVRSLFALRRLRQLTLRSVEFDDRLCQAGEPGALSLREWAAGLASLEVLELLWRGEAPLMIAAIPSLPKLRVLCIACTELLDFHAKDGGSVFPALTSLRLVNTARTAASQWQDIFAIPTLTELRCPAFCDKLPLLDREAWEVAWVALHPGRSAPKPTAHESLRRLHLTDVDENILDHVARLPHLEELDVSTASQFTLLSFSALREMLSLRILNVASAYFDRAAFAAAASLPRLWCLNMRNTSVKLADFLRIMDASKDDSAMPFPSLRMLVPEGMPDEDILVMEEWAAEHRPGLVVAV